MKKILLIAFLLLPFATSAQTPGAQPEFCVTSSSQTLNYNQLCISASPAGGQLGLTSFGSATGTLNVTQNGSVLGGRIRLAAPLALYADFVNGNDVNSCLAPGAGSACKTVQAAFNKIVQNYDTGGQTVTINFNNDDATCLAIGTGWTGGGPIVINGPGGSPPAAGLDCNVSTTMAARVGAPLPAALTLQNMKIGGLYGIYVGAPATVFFSNINFGPVGQVHVATQVPGAFAQCIGNYTISGGAGNHLQALLDSAVRCTDHVVTLIGTPAFSTAYAFAGLASTVWGANTTFSGSATGTRYVGTTNGVLETGGGGPSYFPGDTAGVLQTGGQYE